MSDAMAQEAQDAFENLIGFTPPGNPGTIDAWTKRAQRTEVARNGTPSQPLAAATCSVDSSKSEVYLQNNDAE